MDKPNQKSFSKISPQSDSNTVVSDPESNFDLLDPLAESTSDRHFTSQLIHHGGKVDFVYFTNLENLVKSLENKPAKFVHWEPYVNPTMEVLNTPYLIEIAKQNGASIILDNTF